MCALLRLVPKAGFGSDVGLALVHSAARVRDINVQGL